jgi:hypothetical protein
MLAVLLVANTKLVRPEAINGAALNWMEFEAGISVAGILPFPWYHTNQRLGQKALAGAGGGANGGGLAVESNR